VLGHVQPSGSTIRAFLPGAFAYVCGTFRWSINSTPFCHLLGARTCSRRIWMRKRWHARLYTSHACRQHRRLHFWLGNAESVTKKSGEAAAHNSGRVQTRCSSSLHRVVKRLGPGFDVKFSKARQRTRLLAEPALNNRHGFTKRARWDAVATQWLLINRSTTTGPGRTAATAADSWPVSGELHTGRLAPRKRQGSASGHPTEATPTSRAARDQLRLDDKRLKSSATD
jgi:hypothetical protein